MVAINVRIFPLLLLFRIITNSVGAQELRIWEIQGAGATSPFVNQTVTTTGNVVTAKGSGFFFIQSPTALSDNNPATSDALLVDANYFGSVGDIVDVSGLVTENDGNTSLSGNIDVATTGSGAALPAAIVLDENLPSPSPSTIHSLEKVENMRIRFTARAVSPSNDFELAGLAVTESRPFREPGIRYPGLNDLPVWDGNPEIFWMDPNGLGAPNNRFINAGDQITGEGIMLEADDGFWLALPSDYDIETLSELQAVPEKNEQEFTVGSFNLLFLFSNSNNLDARLNKLALYIVEQMRSPDILAVQEAGSLGVLQDLAYYIEQLAPGTDYQAYLLPGNDDIKLGYLVKNTIQNIQITELGKQEVFTFGGLLHDRPPLLLQATLPTTPATLIQVLNIHMRSLIGIEGSSSSFVRNKRHQQAISIANMIQQYRSGGNLLIVGDYNAFEFSDGYVDVFNQMSGDASVGAQISPLPIVAPPLMEPIESLPAEERYSYVFQGSAQSLDHCLISELEGLEFSRIAYARGNADYAIAYESNAAVPQSCSDHDGFVVYLAAENPLLTTRISTLSRLTVSYPQPARAGQNIRIHTSSGVLQAARIYDINGRLIWQCELPSTSEATLVIPPLPAQSQNYLIEISSTEEVYRNWLIII
jgi:hypothetical protein